MPSLQVHRTAVRQVRNTTSFLRARIHGSVGEGDAVVSDQPQVVYNQALEIDTGKWVTWATPRPDPFGIEYPTPLKVETYRLVARSFRLGQPYLNPGDSGDGDFQVVVSSVGPYTVGSSLEVEVTPPNAQVDVFFFCQGRQLAADHIVSIPRSCAGNRIDIISKSSSNTRFQVTSVEVEPLGDTPYVPVILQPATVDPSSANVGDSLIGTPATFSHGTTEAYVWQIGGSDVSGENDLSLQVPAEAGDGRVRFGHRVRSLEGATTSFSPYVYIPPAIPPYPDSILGLNPLSYVRPAGITTVVGRVATWDGIGSVPLRFGPPSVRARPGLVRLGHTYGVRFGSGGYLETEFDVDLSLDLVLYATVRIDVLAQEVIWDVPGVLYLAVQSGGRFKLDCGGSDAISTTTHGVGEIVSVVGIARSTGNSSIQVNGNEEAQGPAGTGLNPSPGHFSLGAIAGGVATSEVTIIEGAIFDATDASFDLDTLNSHAQDLRTYAGL